MGTSAGAKLYTLGSWIASMGFSIGLLGLALVILFARGPHAIKWIGWDGGRQLRKSKVSRKDEAEPRATGDGSPAKHQVAMEEFDKGQSLEMGTGLQKRDSQVR
jgi:hypothetical protein